MRTFKTAIILILLSISLLSCSDQSKEIKSVSEEFIRAYIRADHTTLSAYCTDSLAEVITPLLRRIDMLDATLKNFVLQSAEKSKIEILSTHKRDKNSFEVRYRIQSDSSSAKTESLLILDKVGDSWKVSGLAL